ncbi:hypothetical protein WJX72_006950 [[Myrmecia] bisecta]|uniref:Deoxyribodipyrimidine photo-lyase n=1 Tax=[Myrmecia] bisecta TaxID=41462 RepID=A0AAW1QFD2_9CHLO
MGTKRKAEAAEAAGGQAAHKSLVDTPTSVNPKRVRELKPGPVKPGPVVYWMSRDQRVRDNWALLHACEVAAKSGAPVAIAFNLVPAYLNAGARQFGFMLRGLQSMQPKLEALNIPFFLLKGDPTVTIPQLVKDTRAGLLVTDFAPLRLGREWREKVAAALDDVPFHEVDAHNVVPCWLASDKKETGARTIRPKIHRQLPEFLTGFFDVAKQPAWNVKHKPEALDWDALIKEVVEKGKEVPEVNWCKPGEDAAVEALIKFMAKERLKKFDDKRNDPNAVDAVSGLSAYIHFGQLSPQYTAFEGSKLKETAKGFIEELVVRRELADNFCYYEPNYDNIDGAAKWARESLELHKKDKREHVYTREQFERGQTYDELWNAAQLEMVHTGKMHGFMRMYWAKKILEWTNSAEEALEMSIYLNDKWEMDGRDPNGYVGCMWSCVGTHDQGWAERPIFGKIRYMNYNGCKRKFDVNAYIKRISDMCAKMPAIPGFA